MRVAAKKALRDFWTKHRDAEEPLFAWYREAEDVRWTSPAAIKARYASASVIGDNRVVFHIKGNRYRLVVKINYPYGVVYIRFVGTHEEYDAIDAEEV